MSLLNYYVEEKFNPVPITFFKKKNILEHFHKRKNLLEKHLKIPMFLLKDKDILEFGCNGAENACVMAIYGAKIHLVEPNIKMHKLIKSNFRKIKKNKSLKILSSKNLENFNSKKKFDFVITEGFLNTLKDRNIYFKKLTKFLNPNGCIILNYDDSYGGLFELIKSTILLRICNILKIHRYSDHSIKIAKKLFNNEFKQLKSTRTFKAWWKDQLVNPYASKIWSLKEILNLSNKSKMYAYSTSPIFDQSNYFKWYKEITNLDNSYKKINFNLLESWKQSFLQIILNKKIFQKYAVSKETLFELDRFVNQMCKIINGENINSFKLIEPKNFINFLYKNKKKKLSYEIKEFVKIINNCNDEKKILKFYRSTNELKNTWGSVLHYLTLIKN